MHIIWDEKKNKLNIQKHNVSFEEAKTIFYDPLTKVAHDPDHSEDEERFIAVGYSIANRLLLVIHCYKENDSTIRIISARKVTNSERKEFEEEIL